MLTAATRFAAGVLRFLVYVIFGSAGTVVGAVVGLLTGFINENGLMQGTLVGAISGALVSVELADSLLNIWCSDDCSMDTRIKRTRLVLRNLVVNRVLRGSAFPTISSALDSQIDALQPRSGRGDQRGGGDMFEPSSPVMAVRGAAVESLPVTKLTAETAAQQATTCPICLHEFQAGERARRLPACCHVFHLACIDSWLVWNAKCPMCRHAVY